MPEITRRKRKEKAITTTHGHGLVVASEYYTIIYKSNLFCEIRGEIKKKLDRVKVSFIPTTVSVECTKNNVKFE